MIMDWENRCLICDHIWKTYGIADCCPECGEIDEIFCEEADE